MSPIFFLSPLQVAAIMIGGVVLMSLLGLILFRRFITPRIRVSEEFNEAIGGTVQTIGLFYGVTVGLLSVGVWDTLTTDNNLVSKEAASIAALYRDVGSLPEPGRTELQKGLKEYTQQIIQDEWSAQRRGDIPPAEAEDMGQFQAVLMNFQPPNEGDNTRYAETLAAYNDMLQERALRIDAVGGGLSGVMWWVIWCGAIISIVVAYFYHLKDARLHAVLIALMGAFLGLVLFMIVMNDHPFVGYTSIGPDSYQLVYERVMGGHK